MRRVLVDDSPARLAAVLRARAARPCRRHRAALRCPAPCAGAARRGAVAASPPSPRPSLVAVPHEASLRGRPGRGDRGHRLGSAALPLARRPRAIRGDSRPRGAVAVDALGSPRRRRGAGVLGAARCRRRAVWPATRRARCEPARDRIVAGRRARVAGVAACSPCAARASAAGGLLASRAVARSAARDLPAHDARAAARLPAAAARRESCRAARHPPGRRARSHPSARSPSQLAVVEVAPRGGTRSAFAWPATAIAPASALVSASALARGGRRLAAPGRAATPGRRAGAIAAFAGDGR